MNQYWSSLEEAWEATDGIPQTSLEDVIDSPARCDGSWWLIDSEPRDRLIALDPASPRGRVLCKIHRIPPHLRWRTLGLTSRASREFFTLKRAQSLGLPVPPALGWEESRRRGMLGFHAITIGLVAGANLEAWLRREEAGSETRMRLARSTGLLLGRLHRAGLFWGAAPPRNVLVPSDRPYDLMALDLPYASWHGRDIRGWRMTRLDLEMMAYGWRRHWGFGESERKALLAAYFDGDEVAASRMYERLAPMTRRRRKMFRLFVRARRVLSPGRL